MRLAPVVVLALTGCSDIVLYARNSAPEARITGPEHGTVLRDTEVVAFFAEVTDEETDLEDLTVIWSTPQGGPLSGEMTRTTEIVRFVPDAPLPAGTTRVQLLVLDPGGLKDRAHVAVEVVDNAPPTVTFESPVDGGTYAAQLPLPVALTVHDADADGPLSMRVTGAPFTIPRQVASGQRLTSTAGPLPAGRVTLGATATDGWDGRGSGAITVTLVDGDQDGDGAVDVDLGGDDCDDTNPDAHPDAPELCNGLDDDCDGAIDEDPIDPTTWHRDGDGDGWGGDDIVQACTAPTGFVEASGDCDDARADVHPDATERCDARDTDEDCDGLADDLDPEGAAGGTAVWPDSDGDGFGHPLGGATLCDPGDGWALVDTDCDDARADVNPGAPEVCDPADTDEDCDGLVDDADPSASGKTPHYGDGDGDGHGAGVPEDWCDAPPDRVALGDDCDDARADVSPSALEICDPADTDEDCDGLADDLDPEGAAGGDDAFADTDGDGFGDPSAPRGVCDLPPGFVWDARDCDDARPDVHPDAAEVCDPLDVDEDCDGLADDADPEGAEGTVRVFPDLDSDGFGDADAPGVEVCDPDDGVADATDCDDGRDDVHPDADEVCDPLDTDEDCDGFADDLDPEGPVDGFPAWEDDDGDGFGGGDPVWVCDLGDRFPFPEDCDDGDADVGPGGVEVCGDGVDGDCDGLVDDGCVIDHCDGARAATIDVDTVWAGHQVHEVLCDIDVRSGATLTIEDGALVQLGNGVRITIGSGSAGSLQVDGDPDGAGVLFTSAMRYPTPGDWMGIRIAPDAVDSHIDGAWLEYAGDDGEPVLHVDGHLRLADSVVSDAAGDAVEVTAGGSLALVRSEIVDNAGDGVTLASTATLVSDGDDPAHGNRIAGNGGVPLRMPAQSVGLLDGTNALAGNGDDAVVLVSSAVIADAEWFDHGVPYRAESGLVVGGAAAPIWTLHPGVTVEVVGARSVTVGHAGPATWIARDATFTSADAVPGAWDRLHLGDELDSGGSSLVGLTVAYAGVDDAAVNLEGDGGLLTLVDWTVADSGAAGLHLTASAHVGLDGVTVVGTAGIGVDVLRDEATVAFVRDSVVTEGGDVPVRMYPRQVEALDPSSSFVGNAVDRAAVRSGHVRASTTWPALDVPYRIDGPLWVSSDDGLAALTLAPGADLRFVDGASLTVGYLAGNGALVVDAAHAPARLVGEAGVPGEWVGVVFSSTADLDASFLAGVEIAHTGSYVHSDAALFVDGTGTLVASDLWLHDGVGDGITVTLGSAADLSDSVIEGFTLDGVSVAAPTGRLDGRGLSIHGCGDDAVALPGATADGIADGLVATGNGTDGVRVLAADVQDDATWSLTTLPWVVDGAIAVGGADAPTLTLVPGTTLLFDDGGDLRIGAEYHPGSLLADAAAGDPIVFGSAQPAPAAGDWPGILSGSHAQDVVLVNAVVEHGGGNPDFYRSGGVSASGSDPYLEDVTFRAIDGWCVYGIYGADPTVVSADYESCTLGEESW